MCTSHSVSYTHLMERLSDKAVLKELISKTGLSVIPGTKAVPSVEEAIKAAEKIG